MVLAANFRERFEDGVADVFAFIPELIGALVILVIGYFVAKLIGGLVARLLHRAGVDRSLQSGQSGQWISKVTTSPSRLLGRFAFWALMLGVISLAVSVLGIDALTAFVGEIFEYLPNVIAAFLIFLVAGAVATGVAALVGRTMGDTPTGRVVATIVPGLIMAIAIFMILNQLKIAEEIVTITYAALIGAFALAAALAFGLGGREVAGRMLQGAYQKGQESREQVKQDVQQGKERAREDIDRVKDKGQEVGAEGDAVAGPPTRAPEPVVTEPVAPVGTTEPVTTTEPETRPGRRTVR